MNNGVYSQFKSAALTHQVLDTVEQQMGQRLHADIIVIASQYGGTIDQPSGYQYGRINLHALRAISATTNANRTVDGAEAQLYDDIGTTANGDFTFVGYYKRLSF